MYLRKKTYVKRWEFNPPEDQFLVIVTRGGKLYPAIDPEKVSFITEEAAYWRKANSIHAWFVRECQEGNDDCGSHYVPRDKLAELVAVCHRVLDARGTQNGPRLIEELLPPQEGFFFGSTEIDQGYYDDLENTIRQIEPLLKPPSDGEGGLSDFEYHSSW